MNDVESWVRRGSLAAMLLIAASYSGYTLAIDCTAVTSNIDKVVCSQLSNQDAKLNEDYSEAMNWLSPEGQSALRADQRAWLRYRVTACGFADGGNSPGDVGCLSALIRRRDDRLLWLVAHQDRPSLFTYFVRSSYETTPDPSGGLPFWSESSTPQIDSKSLSPNLAWSDVQTWNALIAKLIGGPAKSSVCPGGKGDIYREPHVYVASILLITVSEDRDDTCRGLRPNLVILRGQGPLNDMLQDHFMSETQYNVVMMRGDVHLLQASDLFSAGDAWKRLLTERVEQEVQKQALGHRENWHPSADAIERVATDPSNWLPGNTFSIRVSQSALSADEMIGGFTVRIPWSDLQSVLSFKGKRILTAPNW
jgi:uncharacterized protein YecT (DUF1311 family)